MLQTDVDYPYNTPPIDSMNREFTINTSSVLDLDVMTRNGDLVFESIVPNELGVNQQSRINRNINQIEYTQDKEGFYHLPLLGKVNLNGMTVFEAQKYLSELFASFFVEPYCILRIVNARFIFFSGAGSKSSIVQLPIYRCSLLEAITIGGGIHPRGISSQIKVIRRMNGKDEVYLFDFSKIDALKFNEFYIQNGDIVYVEPRPLYAAGIMTVISPIVTLASTLVLYLSILAK
jgi:polysaccharide export outer membrane protein